MLSHSFEIKVRLNLHYSPFCIYCCRLEISYHILGIYPFNRFMIFIPIPLPTFKGIELITKYTAAVLRPFFYHLRCFVPLIFHDIIYRYTLRHHLLGFRLTRCNFCDSSNHSTGSKDVIIFKTDKSSVVSCEIRTSFFCYLKVLFV